MSDNYQLESKHIDQFVKEVQRWCRFFNIGTYEVGVDENASDASRASCWADVSNGLAIISVNKVWDVEPTRKHLSRAAFHEVVELLLIELASLAASRFASEDHLEVARHRVIITLENSVWKDKFR